MYIKYIQNSSSINIIKSILKLIIFSIEILKIQDFYKNNAFNTWFEGSKLANKIKSVFKIIIRVSQYVETGIDVYFYIKMVVWNSLINGLLNKYFKLPHQLNIT